MDTIKSEWTNNKKKFTWNITMPWKYKGYGIQCRPNQ